MIACSGVTTYDSYNDHNNNIMIPTGIMLLYQAALGHSPLYLEHSLQIGGALNQ